MSNLQQMQAVAHRAANLLKLFSHPDRLMLLCLLSKGEYCVNEIGEILGIHQPSLSQQLGILRQEALVVTRREGKQMYYKMASEDALAILNTLYKCFCSCHQNVNESRV